MLNYVQGKKEEDLFCGETWLCSQNAWTRERETNRQRDRDKEGQRQRERETEPQREREKEEKFNRLNVTY